MKKKTHWRLKVLKWHRRIGVVLSVFLLWMLASGILINHANDLQLDKQQLNNEFWLKWYGLSSTNTQLIGDKSLSLNKQGLWLNQQNLGECSNLLGVAKSSQEVVVVCPEHILLLLPTGELIDHVDKSRGLSIISQKMAVVEQKIIVLANNDQLYQLDTQSLSFSPFLPVTMPINWQEIQQPQAQLSYEQWLLDAHSGRLFGAWGKWLVDVLSVLLIMLIVSGWFLAKRRHQLKNV